MDDQNRPINASQPPPKLNPTPNPEQSPYTSIATEPKLTDTDAQTLLTINNLQTKKPAKRPSWLLIVTIIIVVALIGATAYKSFGHTIKKTAANSNTSLPGKNNPLTNGGTINQQVQYCSNVINASTVC